MAKRARRTHAKIENLPQPQQELTDREAETVRGGGGGEESADGLEDMTEQNNLQLQGAMDRSSLFLQTLSNLLRSQQETADSLVQNPK